MDWHLHLDVILLCSVLLGGYLLALWELRPAPRWLNPIEARHVGLFSAGVLVIFLAEGTPLHELSEIYLFSAHMVQHMLLTFLVPPLLLLGMPSWLLRPLTYHPWVFAVARFFTKPIVAIVLFNLTMAFWHVPALYEATLQNHNLHIFNHFIYLFTGVLLWWPVFSPMPELPRISYPAQMMYLFIQSLVPAILASVITFSDTVVYPLYAVAPRVWDMSPLMDQQIGGLIMKIAGGLALWLVAGSIFFIWFNHEEREPERSWD